ncbi:adenine phosphoribosyltransferase [Pedobacter sp. SYSU D00535]|uniref:adenine phosphoribosyltransferase n=1 Tax=Pedobacter sp. SYSU D00535 TaxID=2810308 RepID=UPI001A97207C|nr:adenine phosphoribosyltransferase [Pedobacter sp. SYSU D00535]
MISEKIKRVIRDIHDFPKPGIIFKDVTPIFKDSVLCTEILDSFAARVGGWEIDVVAGIESRGFLFGLMLANRLGVPFIPVRKPGKLPFKTVSKSYELEYGAATIEIHQDAFEPGKKVLIHDDLLATGGTATATAQLVEELGGAVSGYCFVVGLDFLNGDERLRTFSPNIVTLTNY